MYATCLFCHAPLGANEMLESFPVGRRLAFDAARGRLWVVCASCKQWSLSPLDERWEAVEEAERLYRATRKRVATDQIGLARLRDGTELVRIGEPLRPEFAAWRYGERFGARWRRQAGLTIAGVALVGGYIVAGPVMGLIAGGVGTVPWNLFHFGQRMVRRRRVVARLQVDGTTIVMTDAHVERARAIAAPEEPEGWRISVPHRVEDVSLGRFTRSARDSDPSIVLSGEEAWAAARALLPRINRSGGRARTVEEAVRVLEDAGSPNAGFRVAADRRAPWVTGHTTRDISTLPAAVRLALEMAAHEQTERRAFEGELKALEDAWREAEEVAAIADDLTLPERIGERLERLRR